jgi:hypothetical protein
MSFIIEHWSEITAIIVGIGTAASVVVKLTPTEKDDAVFAKIAKVLSNFGIKLVG